MRSMNKIRNVLQNIPCRSVSTHSQLSKNSSTWAPASSITNLYINDIKYRILLKVRKFMLSQPSLHKYLN